MAFAEFAAHMPHAERDTFLSLEVVRASAIVDGTFKDVDYSAGVKATQASLYRSEHFTVQSLVRGGEYGLTACYPSIYRPAIEAILKSQGKRLAAILAQETRQIRHLQAMLSNYKTLRGSGALIGEFVGGFVSGFLRTP
jgi:hypothetical protein